MKRYQMQHCVVITFIILVAPILIRKHPSIISVFSRRNDEQVNTSLLAQDVIEQRNHLSQQLNRLQVQTHNIYDIKQKYLS